ncbi:hypothetical protein DPMN_074818, partial [Dreissena polymorpha]
LDGNVRRNILGFNALTGCDTVSALNGISKTTAWVKYIAQPDTLEGVGRDGDALAVSKFLCVLYGCCQDHPPNIDTLQHDNVSTDRCFFGFETAETEEKQESCVFFI